MSEISVKDDRQTRRFPNITNSIASSLSRYFPQRGPKNWLVPKIMVACNHHGYYGHFGFRLSTVSCRPAFCGRASLPAPSWPRRGLPNQILCRPRHKSLNFSCQTKKSLLYVYSLAEIDHPATQPVGAESEDVAGYLKRPIRNLSGRLEPRWIFLFFWAVTH
jgi:hypothetical protein